MYTLCVKTAIKTHLQNVLLTNKKKKKKNSCFSFAFIQGQFKRFKRAVIQFMLQSKKQIYKCIHTICIFCWCDIPESLSTKCFANKLSINIVSLQLRLHMDYTHNLSAWNVLFTHEHPFAVFQCNQSKTDFAIALARFGPIWFAATIQESKSSRSFGKCLLCFLFCQIKWLFR